MTNRDPFSFQGNIPTLPGNSQSVMALDSTRRFITLPTAGAARSVPGVYRHQWRNARIRGTITPTGQAITVNLLLMTNPTVATNSAWSVDTTAQSAGVVTVASGVAGLIDWAARTPDWAVEIQAGGTAPSAVVVALEVIFDQAPVV
jgi:hypothetical protein